MHDVTGLCALPSLPASPPPTPPHYGCITVRIGIPPLACHTHSKRPLSLCVPKPCRFSRKWFGVIMPFCWGTGLTGGGYKQ